MATTTNCQGEAADFVVLLKACAKRKDLHKGSRLHADIVRTGLLQTSSYVANTLVSMYAKCGALATAQQLFDELPLRDVVSWNALITGYVHKGQGEEALKCFDQMGQEGHSPNEVTFICVLKACASLREAEKGEQIHREVVKQGLLANNILLGTALLDMYAKCGALAKAWRVLYELPVRNVVAWNALITGYAQQGQGEEALSCFDWMQQDGISPNAVTFLCVLKACGSVGAAEKGEQIHNQVVKQGLLETNIALGNTLVDMYVKCNELAKAQQLLDKLPVRDPVSWSALIAGYTQHGQGEEALNCFDQMQCEGLSPDAVTFLCILKACASIGAVDKGEQIHDQIVRQALLEKHFVLGTALLHMYAKCGVLLKARQVLDELPVRNVVSWSALIAGYAQQAQSEEMLKCFHQMQNEGLSPDSGTLVCVLNACSHSGLLEDGQMHFMNMSMKYGITPGVEHHCCMVDLFGRAGEFDKALAVIEKMPSCDYLPVWHALLGACQKWGNVDLGKFSFDHALQVGENDAAAYVCMASIYVAAGMLEDAAKIEVMRVRNKAWKKPGCS